MKKIIIPIIICILVLLYSVVYADDYSSFSDEELNTQLNAIRNELIARGYSTENKRLLLDQSGVQIYYDEDASTELRVDRHLGDTKNFYIPIIIINNTDKIIMTTLEHTSVNGWSAYGTVSSAEVPIGKKSKSKLYFRVDELGINSIDEIEDVEFSIRVYDSIRWYANDKDIVKTTPPITIIFKQ